MRECPKCRLANADTAQVCDCGYDFTTGVQRAKPAPTEAQVRIINSPSWGVLQFGFVYLGSMRAWVHAGVLFVAELVGYALRDSAGAVLILVPLGYYVLKGKRLAWTSRPWRDFDDFLSCQRYWDTAAKALLGIGVVFVAVSSLLKLAIRR